jgi:hypothetical protein
MIHNQNLKVVGHTSGPVTVGSTATTTMVVDRRNYDYASVVVSKAPSAGTSFASVLKIEESDDNSSYDDVAAFVKDGASGFTMAAVSTVNGSIVKIDVDCKARKRYLRVTVTPDVTAAVSVVALLSRGEEFPSTETEVNVAKWVKG